MPSAAEDGISDHHRHQIPTTTENSTINRHPSFLKSLKAVFSNSFKIFISNPKMFSSIFLLLALPLSLLLCSLSLASASLHRRIVHLQSLATIVSVRIEALNILDEAKKDSKSLFRIRALHALICLPLSVLVIISSVSSAACILQRRRRRASISSVLSAVRSSWWRSVVTGVLGHAAQVGYGEVVRTAAVIATGMAGPVMGLAVSFVSTMGEVFLKSVLDMGMVVSVVEDKCWGVEAVRIGWDVMEGKRMVGWAVAGVVEVATAAVWWEMVGVEKVDVYGGDWKVGFKSTVGMGLGMKVWIASLYALILVWSNVLLTALNCDGTATFNHVEEDDI